MKSIEQRIRSIIARITGWDAHGFGADVPLFRGGLELDSLSGTQLVLSVEREFRVSIADEDWDLESLHSVQTLCRFVSHMIEKRSQGGCV